MKNFTYLALVALLSSLKSFAQAYQPMPDSNAVWMQGTGLYNAYKDHPIAVCDGPLFFGRDTMIAGRSYHQLFGQKVCKWRNDYQTQPPAGTVTSGTDYEPVALRYIFRQDIAQRKVYLHYTSTHRDTLLYDFNLTVGQIYPATVASPLSFTVTGQSVMSLGGIPHRTWDLGYGNNAHVVSLIEGLGSSQGFGTEFLVPLSPKITCIVLLKTEISSIPIGALVPTGS